MKLRTITGTRWPARCADGCGTVIEPSTTAKVVVDFDAHPRKTWIPEHSPDARTWKRNGPAASPAPSNGGNGHGAAFTPASSLPPPAPAPPPKAPEPPLAPSPPPLALLASTGNADATPNPASGVPWATASLTFNAGSFESARAGLADYAQPGETCEQLRERISRLVLEDLERSVRAMRELHERLSDASGGVGRVLPKGPGPSPPASPPSGGPFGGDTAIRTPSPARAAGAPSGASATAPSSPPSSASAPSLSSGVGTARGGGRPACPSGPEVGVPDAPRQDGGAPSLGGGTCHPSSVEPLPSVAELVKQVETELTDASVRRKRNKLVAARKLLELRGLRSLHECGPADERALRALLATFEAVDLWDLKEPLGTPAPQLDERLVLPA